MGYDSNCPPPPQAVTNAQVQQSSYAKQNEHWYNVEQQIEQLAPGFLIRLAKKYQQLSSAELHVCGMVRCGLKSYEIAEKIFVTEHTVEKYRSNARRKLQIKSKVNLEVYLKRI